MHLPHAHMPMTHSTGTLLRQEVTGTLVGGVLTAPAGGTVFSISDGLGQIVDNFTNVESPTLTHVHWTGKSSITDTGLTSSATYVMIDSTGGVTQSTTVPTHEELHDKILIGVIAHANNLIIASAVLVVASYQNGSLAQDLFSALGTITTGCTYSGVAAALQMSRAAGVLYRRGAGYSAGRKSPNEVSLSAQTPVQFASYCRNGSNTVFSNSTVGTTLTVNRYDDGTAAAAGIPNGVLSTNRWQALRLFLSPNGFTLMQYGQTTYNSLQDAQAGVAGELWYQAPITTLTAFRGYLFVRGGAADLSSSGDAFFQSAGKLGDVGASLANAAVPSVEEESLINAGLAFQPRPVETPLVMPYLLGNPQGTITSDTYTPTLTNVANLDASTAYSCQWVRVGAVVTVSGKVDLDPTAAAATQLGISLPVASNFANAGECGGTAAASGIAGQVAAIRADATNNRAELVFIAVDVTNQPMYFSFTYRII